MHLNFIVNKNTPLAAINLKIMVNDTTYLIKTPLRILVQMWDEIKQRPKNIYLKVYKNLNQRLNRLRVGITAYLLKKKESITSASLNRIVKKLILTKKEPLYKDGSFLYYTHSYIKSREHLISLSTCKRYKVFLRLFERYEGYCSKELMVDEVNVEFVKQFLEFGKEEQYSESTIYRSIHFVRTVLNYLEKRGIRTFAYELDLPRQTNQKGNFITLNKDELQKIKETEVPPQLQPAKDWLMISCFTGQRVSDFMEFSSEKLQDVQGKKCIAFTQQKTRKSILLPLHPVVTQLLKNGNAFPERLTVQKYNVLIKEVVKHAGITSKIKVRKRRGFRSSEEFIPKWEAVSSHIGRRSFASNFYGIIPTALLMEATGHSTEEMFKRYISNVDNQRAMLLGNYFDHHNNLIV